MCHEVYCFCSSLINRSGNKYLYSRFGVDSITKLLLCTQTLNFFKSVLCWIFGVCPIALDIAAFWWPTSFRLLLFPCLVTLTHSLEWLFRMSKTRTKRVSLDSGEHSDNKKQCWQNSCDSAKDCSIWFHWSMFCCFNRVCNVNETEKTSAEISCGKM